MKLSIQKLSEQTVQKTAQHFLEKRYRKKARKGRIFSKLEVRTRKKYGNKRADALLVFRHFLWGVYVVSMEAKSYKTLPAMKPYRDHGSWIIGSLKGGLYTCILSGAFYALFKMNDGFVQYLLPINIFLMGAILYALFTYGSDRHQMMDVIEQIRQYPANDQWLAFSKDSFKHISVKKQNLLKAVCRNNGIGILIVSGNKRVKVWLKPKRKWQWFSNYLKYYSLEKRIRTEI